MFTFNNICRPLLILLQFKLKIPFLSGCCWCIFLFDFWTRIYLDSQWLTHLFILFLLYTDTCTNKFSILTRSLTRSLTRIHTIYTICTPNDWNSRALSHTHTHTRTYQHRYCLLPFSINGINHFYYSNLNRLPTINVFTSVCTCKIYCLIQCELWLENATENENEKKLNDLIWDICGTTFTPFVKLEMRLQDLSVKYN